MVVQIGQPAGVGDDQPSDDAAQSGGHPRPAEHQRLHGSVGAWHADCDRLSLDYWFSPCRETGLNVTYLFLGSKAATFDQTSDGSVILARPFFDASSSAGQDSSIIAYPGQQSGELAISDANELNSVEVLFRRAMIQQCGRQMDFVVGYRYGSFNENLSIIGSTTYISPVGNVPVGTVSVASDLFDARNEFNGAELGFVSNVHYCRWSLELLTKLALGDTHSQVRISGSTVVTEPGVAPVTSDGGLLARPTNSGYFEQDRFSVIPELGLTLGYDITERLKATVGYSFIFWSGVMRPGDQIDTNVNTTQFPPTRLTGFPAPQSKSVTTDFWAQGFNVGFDYRY